MVNSIIEEIKKGMSGDNKTDAAYLQQQAMKYRNHENAGEILRIISEMALDLLPDKHKEKLQQMMFINGLRLDQAYNRANELLNEKKLDEAIEIMVKMEERIYTFFSPTDEKDKLSFRNRFDEYLYKELFKPEKAFERTPFDFCTYMCFYGYLMIEKKDGKEAERILKKSIDLNPVNTAPRFELAECYKMLREPAKLFSCIKETLPVCSTPVDIARCYCNLGYYCIEIKDYDSAVAFYYQSLLYAPNDRITGELHHIAAITKKQITPPTKEDISKAFKKYKISEGPSQTVINMAYSLGEYCVEHDARPDESVFYYNIAYNLTRDESIMEKIKVLVAKIKNKEE